MDTNKAAYWVALGVLALGLTSEYQRGNFATLHRVAERTAATLCQVSTRAEQTLVALGITSREQFPADGLLAARDRAEMTRDEAQLVREQARASAEMVRDRVRDEFRAQADAIRAQADIQRAQIEQIRWRAVSQVRLSRADNHRVMVICPKTGAQITVNADSDLAESIPEVEVEDTN
jgi:hypothetical protein